MTHLESGAWEPKLETSMEWSLNLHAAEAGAQEANPDGTEVSVLRLDGHHFVSWVKGENKENPLAGTL